MPHLRSAAVNILVPAGCSRDPKGEEGMASILSDMITRGAGKRNNRELTLAMDAIGFDRACSPGPINMRVWGSSLARNLPQSMEFLADILLRPQLPKKELAAAKALALQEIQALEDDPKRKTLVELGKKHFPFPLGNDPRGTAEGIRAITSTSLERYWKDHFKPEGAILAVAGNLEWKVLRDQVEKLFGKWKGKKGPELKLQPAPGGVHHIPKETEQVQIGFAWPSVPPTHPEYFNAVGMVNVLSGGMSSRLFTEVREKRGLCYSVWASYKNVNNLGAITCYAGTTTDKAQETLDVLFDQLKKLEKGIKEEEVRRVKIGIKSSLLIQEESSSSRAGSIASDWYYYGRVRPLEEIQKAVDGLTTEKILKHAKKFPPKKITLVTLGARPLKPPV
ncbi:MAG: insulinase family protein [Gemmataceae bacterium]|nr:insulinase family protein [Gemmataceae bacterium]